MLKRARILLIVLVLAFSGAVYFANKGFAVVEACSISVTPHNFTPNSNDNLTLTVTNNDPDTGDDIQWIQILRPSDAVTVKSVDAGTSWDYPYLAADEARLNNGSVSPGDSIDITINFDAGAAQTDVLTWSVYTSDSPDSGNNKRCDNTNAWINISDSPFALSDIKASSLTSTSATISWTTTQPSSGEVDYGTTTSYGSSTQSGQDVLSTSHLFNISGLSPGTTYHFKVLSSTQNDFTQESNDNTFMTAAAAVSEPPPATTQTSSSKEKKPPVIKLDTKLSGAFKTAPIVSGTATDNAGVAKIEYSFDNGLDWLPVTDTTGIGGKSVSFRFKPAVHEDGNYDIVGRATDTSGNTSISGKLLLVIDRLPPVVGGNIIYAGSQVLQPDSNGVINTLAGVDENIALSAVGGATEVALRAVSNGNQENAQSFTMTKSPDTGLWTGTLSFTKAGMYQLIAKSVDGAGNRVSRSLNKVYVRDPGRVIGAGASRSLAATVRVYYLDKETNLWTVWDGEAYSQNNPYQTNKDGTYGFLLPAGIYYLEFSSGGYKKTVTKSFPVAVPTIVSGDVRLEKNPGFDIGPLHLRVPWFNVIDVPVLDSASVSQHAKSESNPSLPSFALKETNGSTLRDVDLLGKPTVMTFINTWAPSAANQLTELDRINNPSLNVIPVMSGESLPRATAYTEIAGYKLPIVVDSDNGLASALKLSSLPVHYFIDRHGVVKTVVVGVLSKEEILKNVAF